MPDKSDSKIMSMLERSGIIRKSESEDAEPPAGDAAQSFDSDIRPLFDHQEEPATVRTAPRQPVPGLSTPVFPSDKADNSALSAPPAPKPAPPVPAQQPSAPAPVQQAPASYAEPPRSSPSFGSLNPFRNGDTQTHTGSAISAMESALRDGEQPQPENYTDRYLNVDELYDALALRSKKTDTIYLIEDYLKTLPTSLPDSQRREIVSNLLASSGFDFDLLMGDGVLRVKMLKEYAERFARHTDDYIAARQAEMEQLEQQMQRTRRLIDNRKELHKKQFYTIESEAQRLKEILTFISG